MPRTKSSDDAITNMFKQTAIIKPYMGEAAEDQGQTCGHRQHAQECLKLPETLAVVILYVLMGKVEKFN